MKYFANLWSKIKKSSTQQVISITSVGMVLMLILDILIAARFGTTEVADAIIIAITLPLFIDTVIIYGTKYSLVPIFRKFKNQNDDSKYYKFLSGLINLFILAGIGIGFCMFLFASAFIQIIGPGLSDKASQIATHALRFLTPLVIVLPFVSIFSIALDSMKKFNNVALRSTIISLSVISLLIAGWNSQQTEYFVAAGYSVGYIIYAFILWFTLKKKGYKHYYLAFSSKSDLKTIKAAITWPTLGFVARQGGRVAEKSIASMTVVGGVASYYFAYRIISGLQTIIGSSIATTGLPDLSDKKEWSSFYRKLKKNLKVSIVLTLPVFLVLFLFSDHLVQLVFSRGMFETASIERTSEVLYWLSFGIVFMCMIPILNSGLYARERYKAVFFNMVFLTTLSILAALVFASFLGLPGLAMAVSLTAFVSFLVLIALNFRFRK